MASIVVGLFEHRADAEAVLNDLIHNNFEQEQIDLTKPDTEDLEHSQASLRHELTGEGVSEEDARLFEEGLSVRDRCPAEIA